MNKWKRKEEKLSQTFFVRNLSTPLEFKTSWLSSSTQKCFKQLLRTGEKKGQQLTGTPPVIIPETITGCISAPFPFSFLKWQPFFIQGSICQATYYSPSRKAASEFSIDESCSKSCLPRHKEQQWTNISIFIIICWLSVNDKVWKPIPKMTVKITLIKHSHQRKQYVYRCYIVFCSCYYH